jgi:hypothetical protein
MKNIEQSIGDDIDTTKTG